MSFTRSARWPRDKSSVPQSEAKAYSKSGSAASLTNKNRLSVLLSRFSCFRITVQEGRKAFRYATASLAASRSLATTRRTLSPRWSTKAASSLGISAGR